MKSTRFLGIALLLAAGVLAGCSKKTSPTSPLGSSPGAVTSNQAQVMSTIAAAPTAVEDGLEDAADVTSWGGQPGALTAIQPFTFWRTITARERSFEVAFSDTDAAGQPTTAIVTIHKHLTGRFNILVGVPGTDGTPMDSVPDVIHKPLDDEWVRRVVLKRVMPTIGMSGALSDSENEGDHDGDHDGDNDGDHDGDHENHWRVAAVSGVEVTSKDATTHIVSVRVQTADKDTTITDPLAFMKLRKVLNFIPQTQVTITVMTMRNDDVVVLMHSLRRFRFHNNGDNTYTGVFPTGVFMAGLHHIGVNALSNGTLFDDQAPYDSQSWIFPYSLEPESLMSEFMP